jgi:hypothetical protein
MALYSDISTASPQKRKCGRARQVQPGATEDDQSDTNIVNMIPRSHPMFYGSQVSQLFSLNCMAVDNRRCCYTSGIDPVFRDRPPGLPRARSV